MDLNFEVQNQRLALKNTEFIVDKSNNYLKLFFNFLTEDWNDDLYKFAILRNSENKSFQFRITDEGFVVPSDILIGEYFIISAYGAKSNVERITTNEILIKLIRSGYTKDISPVEDYGRDIYVEILELIDNLPPVAVSGSYNDLTDIPEEFNPAPHSHQSSEITDLEETIGIDTKMMLNILKDEIRR